MSDAITIKLRPHHLLCMLTYIGKGYSQNFTENYDAIIEKLNEPHSMIEIIKGPDDICAPRLCDKDDSCHHCHDSEIIQNDMSALSDIQKIKGFENIAFGHKTALSPDIIETLRKEFKNGKIRTACIGCPWHDLCTEISLNNFKTTRLK